MKKFLLTGILIGGCSAIITWHNYCWLCEGAVSISDFLLKQNATETEIFGALEHLCGYVHQISQEQCSNMIEQYGTKLIEAFVNLKPEEICGELHLC